MRALPSPIVRESFHVAPVAGPAGRDSVGHALRNGERYLRVEDVSGEYFRYCSTCTMRHLNGAELVVRTEHRA
jgi:hypothetical protein